MKKLNNKGFSLVELIIVIAIMAVLIGVLAPQFLRYVERSRFQKDNTAVEELRKSIEIALGNEDIATQVGTAISGAGAGANVTVAFDNTGLIVASTPAATLLDTEIQAAIGGNTLDFSSNAYTTTTATMGVVITSVAGGGFQVDVDAVDATGATLRW